MRRYLGLTLLLLAACPGPIDTGESGEGPIRTGPKGGRYLRHGVVVEIPEGALAGDAQLTVTQLDSAIPEVPGRKRISAGYRLSPSGVTFGRPVRLTLPYLEDKVPSGVAPATFDMRRQSEGEGYLALPNPSFNTELKLESSDTDRLGLFWVTSPSEAAVDTLVLDPADSLLAVGQTVKLNATAKDATGNLVELKLSWSAAPPRAGQVDPAGNFTALGPGNVTVTATVGKLSATALVRVQGTTGGPTSFTHDNPFPTGNDLFGGATAADTTYVVGANGTVLERSATGSWTRRFSTPGVSLRAIDGTPTRAVAVGSAGNGGLLVELTGTTPTVLSFADVQPRAVWFDGEHGMAVGDGNDVLVRRNGVWASDDSPSFESLLDVVGDGEGSFTTVGARGSIYRFDPATGTWDSLFQTQLAVLLNAATLVDPAGTEAWAVGGTKLWHFTGSGWSAINLPSTPALSELTAVGRIDGKIAIAGRAGKQGYLLLHEPVGGGFTSVALRGPQVIRHLFSGAGASGYAVGDLGAIWRYQAGTFVEESHGFYGDVADVAVTSSAVVAAVNACVDTACSARQGEVQLRTGESSWAPLGAATASFTGLLHAVAARSGSDVVAAGDSGVYHFNGTAWSKVPAEGGNSQAVLDVQFCGNELWAAGEEGLLLRGSTSALQKTSAPSVSTLTALHCTAGGQVWVTGAFGLYELGAASVFVSRSSAALPHSAWQGVWSPAPGEAFVVGISQYAAYWDTSTLQSINRPGNWVPDALWGIWGSSIDNLYAVGQTVSPVATGYAVRFDGAYWRLIDAGAQRKVTAVHGSSATEVWLGTEGGGLLHGVAP